MASASLIISSSPGATSPLISHSPALSAGGYFSSSRVSKRPCESVKSKRTVRSYTHRDCGQRNSALDRVEAEKGTTTYPDSVPSGSMDSTTNPRRNGSTAGNFENTKYGNYSNPSSKTARKRTKQGKSTKPASPTFHKDHHPSSHPKPSSPTLRRGRPPSPHPSPPTQRRGRPPSPHPSPTQRRGRPPSPHPNAFKSKPSDSEAAWKLSKAEQSELSLGRRTSSAVDSGRGDELSSSCDSDSQVKASTTTDAAAEVDPNCCSRSACSDGDDDVFLDALSNLPSADEHSPSTSAFVTPRSTRSQSPLLPSPPGPSHQDQFIQCLTSSLHEVETQRAKVDFSGDSVFSSCMTGSSEACDTDGSKHTGLVVMDKDDTGTAYKEKQKTRPKKRLNGLVQDSDVAALVGPVEGTSEAEPTKTGKKLLKSKRKKKMASEAATDSCDSSITSDTTKGHSNLKVPKEPLSQASKKRHKGLKTNQLISLESSSISSASPSSSVCSHSPVATSPSPTSFSGAGLPIPVDQSIHPSLGKILLGTEAHSSNLNTSPAGRKEKSGEEKDEWPDLGMECSGTARPKQPGSGVHLHLDVEAKSLEMMPECTGEKEDSGCNMSVGSSTGDSSASTGVHLLEQLVAASLYTGEVLSPQFGDPHLDLHLQSQQFLWLQSQQLNKFIQEHMEQEEQQTDKQIFYPIDPIVEPSHLPHHMNSNLIQTPLFFQPMPLGLPRVVANPRPLFFPAQPASRDSQVPEQSSDLVCPPSPPPPPPLPIRPYCPPTSNKWASRSAMPEVAVAVGSEVATDVSGEGALVAHEVAPSREVTPEVDDNDEGWEYEYHQLADSWVMWYDKITGTTRNHSADYQASLIQLLEMSTIEEFWQLYNNILTPDLMEQNSNFHFFKQGIKPLWEHPANLDGGKWLLTIKNDTTNLSNSWLEVLLLLIGGCVRRRGLINGAVVSRRKKGDRISLWTNTRKEKENLEICAYLMKAVMTAYGVKLQDAKSFLEKLADGKNGLSLVFMHHRDSLKTGHSYQNDARITLTDHLDVILHHLQKITPD